MLLIDEVDRADEAFEAYLLEVLSDFQITIPEIGVVRAPERPIVVITSNRTREVHDALKRRCLYHWVGYPDAAREREILRVKAPMASERLTAELVAFVQRLRKLDLFKSPGVAETLDFASALSELNVTALDPAEISIRSACCSNIRTISRGCRATRLANCWTRRGRTCARPRRLPHELRFRAFLRTAGEAREDLLRVAFQQGS